MPTVFVAFGVTGNLMLLKILPGLFALHQKGELPEELEIIGVSRRAWSDNDLRSHVQSALQSEHTEASVLTSFLQRLRFLQGDISEEALFEKLSQMIGEREAILYFSLSPALYKDTFERLVSSPLSKHARTVRLMIEKPFGTSGASALKLNSILHRVFDEKNIYRADHYLAKESLLSFPHVDEAKLQSIAITFFETMGVEERGASWDTVGALRDVGQNHMLEMLASILDKHNRAATLESLQVLSQQEVATQTEHLQHEGYRTIAGTAPLTQTETYFKVASKWKNIPLILEGGKRMPETRKEICCTYTDGSKQCFAIEPNRVRGEYEKLMLDCLHGDHTLFIDEREVELLWRFIDPVIKVWYQ